MNLLCPDCGSNVRDDGRCDRCAANVDSIALRAPDPWRLAGGLDVRALEDDHEYAESVRRTRSHMASRNLTKYRDKSNHGRAERRKEAEKIASEAATAVVGCEA